MSLPDNNARRAGSISSSVSSLNRMAEAQASRVGEGGGTIGQHHPRARGVAEQPQSFMPTGSYPRQHAVFDPVPARRTPPPQQQQRFQAQPSLAGDSQIYAPDSDGPYAPADDDVAAQQLEPHHDAEYVVPDHQAAGARASRRGSVAGSTAAATQAAGYKRYVAQPDASDTAARMSPRRGPYHYETRQRKVVEASKFEGPIRSIHKSEKSEYFPLSRRACDDALLRDYTFIKREKTPSFFTNARMTFRNTKAFQKVTHFSQNEMRYRLGYGRFERLDKHKLERLSQRVHKNFVDIVSKGVSSRRDVMKLHQLAFIAHSIREGYFGPQVYTPITKREHVALSRLQFVINSKNLTLGASAAQQPHFDKHYTKFPLRTPINTKEFIKEYKYRVDKLLFESPQETGIDFVSWFKIMDKSLPLASINPKTKPENVRQAILDLIQDHTHRGWLLQENVMKQVDDALRNRDHFTKEDLHLIYEMLSSLYAEEDTDARKLYTSYIIAGLSMRGHINRPTLRQVKEQLKRGEHYDQGTRGHRAADPRYWGNDGADSDALTSGPESDFYDHLDANAREAMRREAIRQAQAAHGRGQGQPKAGRGQGPSSQAGRPGRAASQTGSAGRGAQRPGLERSSEPAAPTDPRMQKIIDDYVRRQAQQGQPSVPPQYPPPIYNADEAGAGAAGGAGARTPQPSPIPSRVGSPTQDYSDLMPKYHGADKLPKHLFTQGAQGVDPRHPSLQDLIAEQRGLLAQARDNERSLSQALKKLQKTRDYKYNQNYILMKQELKDTQVAINGFINHIRDLQAQVAQQTAGQPITFSPKPPPTKQPHQWANPQFYVIDFLNQYVPNRSKDPYSYLIDCENDYRAPIENLYRWTGSPHSLPTRAELLDKWDGSFNKHKELDMESFSLGLESLFAKGQFSDVTLWILYEMTQDAQRVEHYANDLHNLIAAEGRDVAAKITAKKPAAASAAEISNFWSELNEFSNKVIAAPADTNIISMAEGSSLKKLPVPNVGVDALLHMHAELAGWSHKTAYQEAITKAGTRIGVHRDDSGWFMEAIKVLEFTNPAFAAWIKNQDEKSINLPRLEDTKMQQLIKALVAFGQVVYRDNTYQTYVDALLKANASPAPVLIRSRL